MQTHQWRENVAKTWQRQATLASADGMYLLAQNAEIIAQDTLAGNYDPPFVADPAVQIRIDNLY